MLNIYLSTFHNVGNQLENQVCLCLFFNYLIESVRYSLNEVAIVCMYVIEGFLLYCIVFNSFILETKYQV